MAYTLFPSIAHQVLTYAVELIGITVISFFLSIRVFSGYEDTASGWNFTLRNTSWPRLCVILVLLDSWLFLFSTGIIVFGIGLQLNELACGAGIYLCIIFYCTSKILIYLFLTEKVYIVWGNGARRLRSPVYLICVGSVTAYVAVVLIMFIGRVEQFRPGDGACVLGLRPSSSIPLLSYDLYINLLLTALFIFPILRSTHITPQMRGVALRTLMAAGVALTTSTVNIAVLTLMKGRELGWVCLDSCGTDVIFNAAALFWVTSGRSHGGRTTMSVASSGGAARATDSNGNPMQVTMPGTPATPMRFAHYGAKSGMEMDDLGLRSERGREFKIHVTTERITDRSASLGPTSPHVHGLVKESKVVIVDSPPPSRSRCESDSTDSQKGDFV
uniref:Transmembrane protein n=1 Tax=Mycena chlorophos TaxID=658473 RepID=A0ABQ0KZK0_MYCCL|nr:predicted protein [Mycena chlorophos]